MKKVKYILAFPLVLIFSFSVMAFATGDVEIQNGENAENGVFNYEYNDGIYSEESLEDIFGEDAIPFFVLSFIAGISSLLFLPALILMIVFIVINNKTVNKIKAYELAYGVTFTKEVINDMKDIPPQNYNYNPGVFVPQYSDSYFKNESEAKTAASFSSALYEEEKKNDGGNDYEG